MDDLFVLVWWAKVRGGGRPYFWSRTGGWTQSAKPDMKKGLPGAATMPKVAARRVRASFCGPRLMLVNVADL